MENYIEKPTQETRILKIFKEARGQWVDGMIFLRLERPITQYHARIWGLEQRGYKFDNSLVEGKNWKKYRLIEQPVQQKLFN